MYEYVPRCGKTKMIKRIFVSTVISYVLFICRGFDTHKQKATRFSVDLYKCNDETTQHTVCFHLRFGGDKFSSNIDFSPGICVKFGLHFYECVLRKWSGKNIGREKCKYDVCGLSLTRLCRIQMTNFIQLLTAKYINCLYVRRVIIL